MKHFLLLLTLTLTIGFYMFLSPKTYAQTAISPSTGDGTEENPYQIATIENLYWLSQMTLEWDKHFIQTADIDASVTVGWDNDSGFTPIGNNDIPFTGTYNGKFHEINNLYINWSNTDAIGFFGFIDSTYSRIDSLILIDANITGQKYNGIIAGRIKYGVISRCYSSGSIHSTLRTAGGIVGHTYHATIEQCYSEADVFGTEQYAGGLIGYQNSGILKNSYCRGSVESDRDLGGAIGKISEGTIENCYSVTLVTGESSIGGGLIGIKSGETIINSFYNNELMSFGNSYGVGLTANQMQEINTFLDAEWDFVNETVNGTEDIWKIEENKNEEYPFLSWQVEEYISGVEDLTEIHMSVYPNPVLDKLTLQTEIECEYKLEIYDLTGKLIFSNKYNAQNINIDLSSFESGMYIVSISTDNERITKKIMKQ